MIEQNKCNKLIQDGFSLITVANNKIPNIKWKQYQNKSATIEEFDKLYNLDTTDNIGIVTGYSDLECIDVDLKVFSTAKEKVEFWEEYLSFLQDNIYDFEDKFVIYKTQNAGYHILYKSKRVEGNLKVAKLKGHNQQVIETRGIGGYIFTYEGNNITDKTYKDVQYISDEDRDILFSVSRTYNYIEPVQEVIPTKTKTTYNGSELTSWDDFNNSNNVIDLIGSQFRIIRQLNDKYIIKRDGAESAHSGYIFKDTGCMYLFSTGTSFDAEKLYSPFAVYAHLNHNDDFSAAAKQLYFDGYGDRIKQEEQIEVEPEQIQEYNDVFPIEIFPESLQKYMVLCGNTLNNSIEYMGCSMLFLTSIIIGNSQQVQIKKGWKESANLWMALIGKAGVGKTPSISSITFPLENANNKEIKHYIKEYQKYEAYQLLSKKEKELTQEIKQPRKTQFIVNDVTLEALIELHNENNNGIGILKDELAGFFKDMNKYREGGDKEHWLSSWSGKSINLNRKTAKSSFVDRAFLPILGGIQPSIMDTFYTDENKDNGFIDRMLFCYPEIEIEYYSESEMKQEHLDWYDNYIMRFYQSTKKNTQVDEEGDIIPFLTKFSPDAKKEFIRIQNEITDSQKSDDENEYMKSMLPKQKAYLARFALIINTLDSIENTNTFRLEITKDSILKAEVLSKYFVSMAKKIKTSSIARTKIKGEINLKKSSYDNFKAIFSKNPDIKKTELAELLNVSRTQIYNFIKKYKQ